jgi:hypothetical protein
LLSGIFSRGIFSCLAPAFRCRRTLAQGILEVDRNAVLLQQVRKRLVGQFLKSRHAVASCLSLSNASSPKAISLRMANHCGLTGWTEAVPGIVSGSAPYYYRLQL